MNWLLAGVGALVLFAFPPLDVVPGWTVPTATLAFMMAVALLGLNLVFGVAGMLAFGQAVFVGLPAYIIGALVFHGVPYLLAILVAVVASVALAFALGKGLVRLSGAYFAIGTLAFAFLVEGMLRAFPDLTGGASGLIVSPIVSMNSIGWYVVSIVLVLVSTGAYMALVRGPFYRSLIALRHDELAAGALGIDVPRLKTLAFTIGSAFSSVGGVAISQYVGVVVPESTGAGRSVEQLSMVIIGGPGHALGPLVGSGLLNWLFNAVGFAGRYELLIYGVLFLLMILFAPRGIVGTALVFGRTRSIGSRPSPMDFSDPEAPRRFEKKSFDGSGTCLRVQALAKHYGGLHAVEDVTFDVPRTAIVALIGPNGAGKSTLFNLLTGIEPPTYGQIWLGDREITSVPLHERARHMGRSFQVPRLIPDLSVLENLVVRFDQVAERGKPEAAAFYKAFEQLQRFGLADLAEKPVESLGIAPRKLIELVRAAVGEPELLLLDEPAVGLTADELKRLADLLFSLRAVGATIVVVEHNVEFVARVADHVFVLDQGRLIASGSAEDVKRDPAVQQAYFGSLT